MVTFDENGYLATIVVDAKKFVELAHGSAALRKAVARLEMEKDLLGAVAEEAHDFIELVTIPELDGRAVKYMDTRQAAIDGEALEEREN